MEIGQIVDLDGPCEVVAIEKNMVIFEPIVRQKTMNLAFRRRGNVRVLEVSKKVSLNINPGKYVDFYI